MKRTWIFAFAICFANCATLHAQQKQNTRNIHLYFSDLTRSIEERCLTDVGTLEDWQKQSQVMRGQLREMLGLQPFPEKTDLKATVTGTLEGDDFVVEKLHFQSRPGLYVTANFYRPKVVDKPLPTVLYVCGHGTTKKDGIAYGSKTNYQHHPAWFARHGFCSLVLDTLQLGEIEGLHHGLHRMGMWWWPSRGYTPAGVEAWNCIRALDYLETRKEVDAKRIGVTGRSGGGAYSWWIAAIDERIACAVPVAGITDMRNHVVDGVIAGHCDCMYHVNTYQWDFATVAALVAPRPLLIANTDKDPIFPLDGVVRLHRKVEPIYRLHKASDRLGLLITEGPHVDTQELQVPAFRWMARWLDNRKDFGVTRLANKPFDATQLKVFATLPADEKNTKIHETFVPTPKHAVAPDLKTWESQQKAMLAELKEKCFRGWPKDAPGLHPQVTGTAEADGLVLQKFEFTTEEQLRLPLYVVRGKKQAKTSITVLTLVDEAGWKEWLETMAGGFAAELPGGKDVKPNVEAFASLVKTLTQFDWAFATIAPRGVGPTQWDQDERIANHIRRRFILLGRTVEDGRVWDTRRALGVLREQAELKDSKLWLQGTGPSAALALYAGLFEPDVTRFDLHQLPTTHRDAANFLNVQRVLEMPQAASLAFPRSVILYDVSPDQWAYTSETAKLYALPKSPLQLRNTGKK